MWRESLDEAERNLLQSLEVAPRPVSELLHLSREERAAFFAMIEDAFLEIENGFVIVSPSGRLALRGVFGARWSESDRWYDPGQG